MRRNLLLMVFAVATAVAMAGATWPAREGGTHRARARAWATEPANPEHLAAQPGAPRPQGVSCRYDCICFRTNGYRCLRTYVERCDGRECWQCQDQVTIKARQSCSIGVPIRSCFCKPSRQ